MSDSEHTAHHVSSHEPQKVNDIKDKLEEESNM